MDTRFLLKIPSILTQRQDALLKLFLWTMTAVIVLAIILFYLNRRQFYANQEAGLRKRFELIKDINVMLTEDIFNRAFAQW